MYDDIIHNIAYSLAMNGADSSLLTIILNFCGTYAVEFCGFLGVAIGAKFLKDCLK